jgi:hypothetical protein
MSAVGHQSIQAVDIYADLSRSQIGTTNAPGQ